MIRKGLSVEVICKLRPEEGEGISYAKLEEGEELWAEEIANAMDLGWRQSWHFLRVSMAGMQEQGESRRRVE